MPRVIENHEQVIEAFQNVDIVSELVERLPNGEFRNELDMDIILFGRSYRGKQVGPYTRLLEFQPGEIIVRENTWESSIFYILVKGSLEASITEQNGNRKNVGTIPAGNSFGEMAMLSGTPRTATVSVSSKDESALVLEFTRPAIRLLRKLPEFGKALDRNYRNYGQTLTLNELKGLSQPDLDNAILQRLNDSARFAVYEKDHVLFREGDPINRVIFVRNGWIQRVSGVAFNPKAADLLLSDESVGLDFLGAGTCLGLEAVDAPTKWKYTATIAGRSEVLEIAVTRLREDNEMSSVVVPFLKGAAEHDDQMPMHPSDTRVLTATSREIETGIVDGVNLLVMDMAKCIRCGNCSLACHKVHGNSRLTRRGIHIERPIKPNKPPTQSILVPTVCMHCQDPECLTGCPTGAIARFPNGEIDIKTETCIGCGDCATQCPYDAISMIARPDAKNSSGGGIFESFLSAFSLGEAKMPASVDQTENLLAVKCNLCHETKMNPKGSKKEAYSCEENCPTGALLRVNPREYFDEVNQTLGLIRRTKTHAIGENIHKFDLWATIWHVIGFAAVLLFGVSAIWATRTFTQDLPLSAGSWVTMRWLTGLTGLAGIIWVMAYPLRKQVYRRRAGALRYWMLSHIYVGVAAGVVLLVHGGTSSGGLLTTALIISFDLVIASGLFGALCYIVVPRFMTKIEREPLLLEDLEARREELRAELVRAADQTSNSELKQLIQRKVRRRFLGLRYLIRQYIKREDLGTMLAGAREEFRSEAEKMSRSDDARLMEAVENAATLRRVDALCYLHQSLKLWVAPHVLFTSLMLVLMVIHIAQVVYFNVR